MKQKDIALIIVIVAVSALLSFFISNSFISPPDHDLEAAVVEPISSDFVEPEKQYFNDNSINPTQIIRIEGTENPNPFQ